MSDLRFADYLDRRRATYTRDWLLLEKLKRQSAFRDAKCSQDIESYLDQSDAPLGVRDIARMAWINYQVAKRKQQNLPAPVEASVASNDSARACIAFSR